ncbi:hypothetical protein M422DRAFT_261851 [Sphaerobolus stellatus SS14]|uniref:Uncharacterized protein n=1 Tax=Sphaerobolus stellatus (strain SS14) TaxID=990650 RepID=A0A0C9VEC4_SPHS4|nr:hypothetical protein M422DRAFT_261851 [Sphaerobolus stellatus SS14]
MFSATQSSATQQVSSLPTPHPDPQPGLSSDFSTSDSGSSSTTPGSNLVPLSVAKPSLTIRSATIINPTIPLCQILKSLKSKGKAHRIVLDAISTDVDEPMLLSSHSSSEETETIFLASGLDLKTIFDHGINYLKSEWPKAAHNLGFGNLSWEPSYSQGDTTFGRSKTAPKLELEKEKREESSGEWKSFLCITRHLVHKAFDIEQDDDIIDHK